MTRKAAASPWQELEEQAYHAYREWPLFLKMRLRDLKRHLPKEAFAAGISDPPAEKLNSKTLLKEYGLITPEEPLETSDSA